MDTGKPEGVSNSQNDKRITRIRLEGAAGEVAHVDLSDGSSFLLPALALSVEGLEVGLAVSDEDCMRLDHLQEVLAARRKALDLLAHSEQPKARLDLKLRARKFSRAAIDEALGELEQRGAVDDLRFARAWISNRARHNPAGRTKLFAELLGRGVSRGVAEEALAGWSDEDEQEALRRAAERLSAKGGDPTRALRALVARGFSLSASKKALDLPELR